MYNFTKEIVAQQKSYGFKNFEKLEVQIFFFFKSQQVGRFLISHAKLQILNWFFSLFEEKNENFLLKVPSLARSVPKPLNFPSLNFPSQGSSRTRQLVL